MPGSSKNPWASELKARKTSRQSSRVSAAQSKGNSQESSSSSSSGSGAPKACRDKPTAAEAPQSPSSPSKPFLAWPAAARTSSSPEKPLVAPSSSAQQRVSPSSPEEAEGKKKKQEEEADLSRIKKVKKKPKQQKAPAAADTTTAATTPTTTTITTTKKKKDEKAPERSGQPQPAPGGEGGGGVSQKHHDNSSRAAEENKACYLEEARRQLKKPAVKKKKKKASGAESKQPESPAQKQAPAGLATGSIQPSKKKGSLQEQQEYLLLNYPADIRRNLKGLKMPDEQVAVAQCATLNDPQDKDDGEWGDEEEWEWEDEEEEEQQEAPVNNNPTSKVPYNGFHSHSDDDDKPVDAKGVADIKIEGSVLKIDRKDVVWSEDEYDDEESEAEDTKPAPAATSVPPPPPPPPAPATTNGTSNIPAPPPMPANSLIANKKDPQKVSSKVEQLKKRPVTRPDWKDLMAEIETFRYGHSKLHKVHCNDRSNPILTTTKIGKSFIYESEKNQANQDIMQEIRKGKRLRHVKTNDRSKPNLRGIRSFRRQCTKEERSINNNGFAFDSDLNEADDEDDVNLLRDDLESTKQLLELEIRSKKLLEKDNKKLQAEVERMREEFLKLAKGEEISADLIAQSDPAAAKARRDSVASKRQSMIRLLSESDSSALSALSALAGAAAAADHEEQQQQQQQQQHPESVIEEQPEELLQRAPLSPPQQPKKKSLPPVIPYQRQAIPAFEQEIIENMKEEVDEARRLAEDWEHKYKEMQRQMTDLDHGNKRISVAADVPPSLQRMVSSSSGAGGPSAGAQQDEDDDEGEGWMLKRELHMLVNKFRTLSDKREIVLRERALLNERMDNIVESISHEVEARKKLRKEVDEMNSAFKDELADMAREELTAKELEECYFSDEELVENKFTRQDSKIDADDDDWENEDDDDDQDDVEETLDDILKLAAEDDDDDDAGDPGHAYFEHYPDTEDEDDDDLGGRDVEQQIELVSGKIERHSEYLQLMRKSNFLMKSKIDRLFDILQMQREKHHDLKQELTRMLADIQ